MYRLLIVDDEELIADGLYEIFRGAVGLDLDVIKVYSAQAAIDWLNRTRIDIVLTDISMPEMNGIALMETIHDRWARCKVIFLTGHSEFEYIYKAIQYPNVSYILKAEGTESVIHAVEKAVAAIDKELETGDLIQNAREQIQMALGLFQKDYLSRLLSADRSVGVSNAQFKELSIPMDASKRVFVMLCAIAGIDGENGYMQSAQMRFSVLQIVERYLAGHMNVVSVTDAYDRFVFLIQPMESGDDPALAYDKILLFLRGILEMIQAACRANLSLATSFAIGSNACLWEAVQDKYLHLTHLLNTIAESEKDIVVDEGEVISNGGDEQILLAHYRLSQEAHEIAFLNTALGQKRLGLMEQYLETGQRDRFFEALMGLLTPLCKIKSRNNPLALETYYMVAMYLMGFINRWGLYEKVAFHMGISKLFSASEFDSWEEAGEYLTKLSEVLFEIQQSQQKKRSDNIIGLLQGYIHSHLNEDISLVRLSEQVYLNPSYLSRMYKQETGENLSDFIDRARIDKAKELMHNDKIKINEIGAMVGYDTAASFTRFFRKLSGLSPQEYRSNLMSR